MKVTILGIDLAKNVFRLHGVDAEGRPVLRKQLRRAQLLPFMRQLTPCLVGLEACHSAHYWGRELEKLGHAVRLMNPRFIKPYLKGEKNDANDAAAICEAVSRPSMRFVPVKNPAQQDIQALHRVREQLIRNRTALVNQARGLLGENGIVVAQGIGRLRQALPSLLEDPDNRLSGLFREMLGEMAERLRWLDDRCRRYEQRIEQLFRTDERAQRLGQIEGVGPFAATALLAAVGNAREFKSGRELAAWLGLVPRQHSSGGRNVLLGISKRGDRYLRTLLIHGARSALRVAERRSDPRSIWACRLKLRRGPNVAAVALANKNVRVMWAMLTRGEDYRRPAAA
jgi:transposase